MIGLKDRNPHPSDEELLLVADRECSQRRASKVREHLAQCEGCHARMSELESTLAGFLSLHEHSVSSSQLSVANSRASLKARLTQAGDHSRPGIEGLWPYGASWSRQLAGACIALLIVAGSVWLMRGTALRQRNSSNSDEMAAALPRKRLTPGATHPVRIDELCHNEDLSHDPPVNVSLEQQVLAEYGVPVAARTGYQLDYLITPELGGSDDIHNLWPEPYSATSWNANVKDALEDHLHDEVCQGRLPLATAQEEIAADWIAAYKREFHTQTPLTDAALLGPATMRGKIRFSPELLAVLTPRL